MTLEEATARTWLAVAGEEARAGLAEGGIPIGAALMGADGTVLGPPTDSWSVARAPAPLQDSASTHNR